MKVRHITIATLLPLLASSPSPCSGFSSSTPNKPRKGQDFTAKVVEDVIVKDVKAKVKVRRNKQSTNTKPLNAREKSFSQRDPIISLNMNLDYLAKSGQEDAAMRCEEMLLRIEALHDDGYYEKSPDVVSYNSVINAYAHGRAARNSRSGRAKKLMKRMEEKGLKPNTITWNTLLRCMLKEIGEKEWKKSPEEKVKEAESILSDMEDSGLANTISYNTVISTISKSGLNDSAERAERWLQRMIELYEATQNDKIQPDTCSWNAVIHAYANVGKNSVGAPDRARRAAELIKQMERLYQSGENDYVKPDVVTYTAVVNAYSRAASQNRTCAVRAMEILEHMVELHEGGDKDVKPNKRTYTSVINAFARIGEPEIADDLLSKMKKIHEMGDDSLKPDTICYSSVLDAYARKGGEDCAFRAEELLREMEDLYNNGDNDVKPNAQTYRSVITALGKSKQPRAAEKAEQILEEMTYISSHGARDLAPNTIVYNAVIHAFAQSKSVSKAYRAELLLERMLEETEKGNLSIRPDTITFNSVINAAARSTFGDAIVRKEAFMIGLNAFRQVHTLDYCRPSSITYVSYLKLIANLVQGSDERDSMAERVFGISHSLGLVNDAVKFQLKKTCSHLVAHRILSSYDDDVKGKQ
eukprot:CAMPEP_0172308110 /NCGR_PEP_ID=MMETSP1058-20130122/8815_1 /TAXON_ID=83371 /ORGANISM="Detonula confervacea, Strain CCMP 353" /LENGTH=640 /DNA_ID=CAMNT_0013020467 /DNA_START=89 /DNA_END=2011 /DNA_ORIENTATION=-